MKFASRPSIRRAICSVVSLAILLQPLASTAALLNLVKTPLFVAPPIPPLVMLDISKDQQLFKKAYNDYSDLDNDGTPETTYKHSIDYYGLFDSYKCYTYNTSNLSGTKHFLPTTYTSDKYCDGSTWSGNFINWVAMSRIDAVRKLLFGGARQSGADLAAAVSDTGSATMLERAFVPSDAHAWAKYYNGTDINKLTPFNPSTTPDSSGNFTATAVVTVPLNLSAQLNFNGVPQTFVNKLSYGDQIEAVSTDGTNVKVAGRLVDKTNLGRVSIQVDSGSVSSAGASDKWALTNYSSPGITVCNVTLSNGSATNNKSESNSQPPLMRVVSGNYELWGANNLYQCYLREEKKDLIATGSSNGNQYALSGLTGSAESPSRDGYTFPLASGLPVAPAKAFTANNTDYNVRVEACSNKFWPAPSGQKTTEKCSQYDTIGSYKPIGLLQAYGDDGRIWFGLMTGSYHKNTSGGVLRKNVGPMSDEIDSDGKFKTSALALPNGSIVRVLSRLRITGYDYATGTYIPNDGNCTYQLTSSELVDDKCRSWGNPMSEIYAESLRYFAGANAATPAFAADDTDLIPTVRTAPWPNPNKVVTADNYCAPLNVLMFNASVSSKDSDQVGDPFSGAVSGFTAKSFTDKVGAAEGLTTTSVFVGSNGVTNNSLCDAKSFTQGGGSFGSAQGICPEAPSLNGSYLMAGLAYAAKTNRIRTDLNASIPATDKSSLKVNTYGIALATNVPRIEIAVPGGATGQKVVIQPVYRLSCANGDCAKIGSGAIVDVKIVRQNATSGRLYVNWEDSEQGGDYDQDVWGVIDWQISAGTIAVTTNIISAATNFKQGFGYVISGTTQDGPHFHSGFQSFSYTDPAGTPTSVKITDPTGAAMNGGAVIGASGGCSSCNTPDVATTATYSISAAGSGAPLKDPLFYAAKYGGFVDSGNGPLGSSPLPDLTAEWDNFNNNTGALGSDGLPDNFYFVTNPLGLEKSLDKLFISILQAAAASAVAANSSKLNTSTRIYQAVFNPSDWSGKLLAFGVNAGTGVPNTTPDWDGGQISLNATTVNPSSRTILTYNKGVSGAAPVGIPFVWPANPASPTATELTPAQITALNTVPGTGTNDGAGQLRLNYLRGDSTNEGDAPTNYRRRPTSKLGDIINSNPNFVGAPDSAYPDAAYKAFVTAKSGRKPMIYVGANDGMLHGFDASVSGGTPGAELLAYIPSSIYRNLSKLTSRTYASNNEHEYFVDGSPIIEDACTGSCASVADWKTVLVGGLNRGGQGIYALNVSDPNSFSQSNAASLVMWEFTEADDPDMGFTFGTPVIRRMANGKFAAIVSGGYNNSQGNALDANEVSCGVRDGIVLAYNSPPGCTVSGNGKGHIFVIYLNGPTGTNGTWVKGTDYFKLTTPTGSVATPNGLATPLAADVDGNGMVDFIYAGDLRGDLWKFDVRSTTAADWADMVNNRVKLFTATDGTATTQPITSGPEAVVHPTGNGFMISFGTGKYLEASDTTGSTFPTQTLYGIWDQNDRTPIATQTVITLTDRSMLMQQNLQAGITAIVQNPDGSISRITSKHLPKWDAGTRDDSASWDGMGTSNLNALLNARGKKIGLTVTDTPQKGWFLDLFNGVPALADPLAAPKGERVIFQPFVRNGIVFYSTLWPLGSSQCVGSTGGDNITLNIGTGARPDASVFDITGDQNVNTSDMVSVTDAGGNTFKVAVSSKRIEGGSAQPPTLVSKGIQDVGFQNTTSGNLTKLDLLFGRGPGRLTWREILY